MKRLILAATLCVIGLVVVPITSASAETLSGSCKLHGVAEFEPGLTKSLEKGVKYHFKSAAGGVQKVGGEGAECVNSEGQTLTGKATVEGSGELACAIAKGGVSAVGEGAGPGALEVGGKKFEFELSFVAAAGNVTLAVKPKGETGFATGVANFLASANEQAANCATVGVKKLEFEASASGTI